MKDDKNRVINPVAPTELDWSSKSRFQLKWNSRARELGSKPGKVKVTDVIDPKSKRPYQDIAIKKIRCRARQIDPSGNWFDVELNLQTSEVYEITTIPKRKKQDPQTYVLIRVCEAPESNGQYVAQEKSSSGAQIVLVTKHETSDSRRSQSSPSWYYAIDAEKTPSPLTMILGIVEAILEPMVLEGIDAAPPPETIEVKGREHTNYRDKKGHYAREQDYRQMSVNFVKRPVKPQSQKPPRRMENVPNKGKLPPTSFLPYQKKKPRIASLSPSLSDEEMQKRSKQGPTFQVRLSAQEEPPRRRADFVESTVFAPASSAPKESFYVQVFATIAGEAVRIDVSGANLPTYKTLVARVDRGSVLSFELFMPGFHIDSATQRIDWEGKPGSVRFAVTVPDEQGEIAATAKVRVSQNDAPMGEIAFSVTIKTESEPSKSAPVGDDVIRFRHAFASYSSRDREEVGHYVQLLELVSIHVFMDRKDLKPGEEWGKVIYENLDACDLFLLFWSQNAHDSEWVKKETCYALERQKKNKQKLPVIKPYIMKGASKVKLWKEVKHLHFYDPMYGVFDREDPASAPVEESEVSSQIGLDCVDNVSDKVQLGFAPDDISSRIVPYVNAIAELQRIITEAIGWIGSPSVYIEEIVAQPTISLSVRGVKQAAYFVRCMLVPWYRDHEAQIIQLRQEIEALQRDERAPSTELEIENLKRKLEYETKCQTLEEARVNLAMRVLDAVNPNLPSAQKVVYAAQLLKPLHILTEGLLMAELKEK